MRARYVAPSESTRCSAEIDRFDRLCDLMVSVVREWLSSQEAESS